jgi:hypothetical protein
MDANNLLQRNGEQPEGRLIAQILLGGERDAG